MFQTAVRQKFRFESSVGLLSVEDLWDLPLTSQNKANLDDVARRLHKQLQSGDNVSFVTPQQNSDETIQLKFDIVKHIIDTRITEAEIAANSRRNKEKKQQILGIIAQKENESLLGTSLEELKAMVEAM